MHPHIRGNSSSTGRSAIRIRRRGARIGREHVFPGQDGEPRSLAATRQPILPQRHHRPAARSVTVGARHRHHADGGRSMTRQTGVRSSQRTCSPIRATTIDNHRRRYTCGTGPFAITCKSVSNTCRICAAGTWIDCMALTQPSRTQPSYGDGHLRARSLKTFNTLGRKDPRPHARGKRGANREGGGPFRFQKRAHERPAGKNRRRRANWCSPIAINSQTPRPNFGEAPENV